MHISLKRGVHGTNFDTYNIAVTEFILIVVSKNAWLCVTDIPLFKDPVQIELGTLYLFYLSASTLSKMSIALVLELLLQQPSITSDDLGLVATTATRFRRDCY